MLQIKKMNKNPIFQVDGYKMCHIDQYPPKMQYMYETWIPRLSRVEGNTHVVVFGLQGALGELVNAFDEHFFKQPIDEILEDYDRLVKEVYGRTNPEFVANHSNLHIKQLHELGYLPIKVKALPEGSLVPIGVPMYTIENTNQNFYWLPGYLENLLSAYVWGAMTVATTANAFKRILLKYAKISGDENKVFMLAGDFSSRGMTSPESAYRLSAGHLLSFGVSATIATKLYLDAYYGAKEDDMSYTPSTEHSVMCSYGKDELHAYHHLITQVHPSGNLSIVSDTYDLWGVVEKILPKLKKEILQRNGKVVIRPDSGDPVKIVCGDPEANNEFAKKGLVQCLLELFGGTLNNKGYVELDSHIGVIYGDSITTKRAEAISQGLIEKGFASTNCVLGVGSYSYQYVTRDTYGFALKATAAVIDDKFVPIYKDPKTDNGRFKKSRKGLVVVVWNNDKNDYEVIDDLNPQTIKFYEEKDLLEAIFENGKFIKLTDLAKIRKRLENESVRVYGE